MSRAVGGYIRRSERRHSPIVRNLKICPYSGISYEDVKAGLVLHPLDDGTHPVMHLPPPLRFEEFRTA